MAKFRFRLQPLLEQKEKLLDDAEKQMTARQKELEAERAEMERLKQREKDLIAQRQDLRLNMLKTAEGERLTGEELVRRRTFVEALGQDIESARDAVFSQRMVLEECEEKLAKAKAYVAECKREVEILVKYRDRLQERHRKEEERKEELELDEVGNMLYMAKRAEMAKRGES
jgi:flagellar export protein FliJ